MVVGGGISGLTAAYRLSQSGAEVVVVEPGPIGGKLQTSVFAGRAVDEAADSFSLREPWALALCHDLELDGELISPIARRAEMLVDGSRRPLPEGHMMGAPTNLEWLTVDVDSPYGAPNFATPIGGMARLIDVLVAFMPGVDIRQGRRATAVEVMPDRSGGRSDGARVTLDDGTVLDTDAVVLAVPAHVAAPVLQTVSASASEPLAAIDHSPAAMVTLAFDRADLGSTDRAQMSDDISDCLVPQDQGLLVTALCNATNKWAQLRDPKLDDVILRVSVGRPGDVRHQDLDDTELTAAVLTDVDRIIGLSGVPTEVRLGRWDQAIPQYAPSHLDRIDQVEAALAPTPIRLAGMALRGVGIPACIQSAEQAAASLGAEWPTRRSLLA